MSDVAIGIEKLGKKYRVGASEPYHLLSETLSRIGAHFLSRLRSHAPQTSHAAAADEYWALQNVSFEVRQGDIVGIIGRNGAGKSTLLKILSRITEPTTGGFRMRGRVGSLLEVGTGFHPELTGRENIYLNGTLLGMSRREVQRKFDEIVAFAEIDRFLDTPVKRYSSGMHVRLGFAVAAHLRPEILIIDEVLAVGDAAFQKKCLGKMGDVARAGRTVLFVSHNMLAVRNLCNQCVWIDRGQVHRQGQATEIVADYQGGGGGAAGTLEQVWPSLETAPGTHQIRLRRAVVKANSDSSPTSITTQTPLEITIEFWNLSRQAQLTLTLHFLTDEGIVAFGSGLGEHGPDQLPSTTGMFRARCFIPGNLLNAGRHEVRLLVVADGSRVIYQHDALLQFEVLDEQQREYGWFAQKAGVVRPRLNWHCELLDPEQLVNPLSATD